MIPGRRSYAAAVRGRVGPHSLSRVIGLKGAKAECMVGLMGDDRKTTVPPPDIPGFPKDWRDQIKADPAAQLEAGGTLHGVRVDGAYVAC